MGQPLFRRWFRRLPSPAIQSPSETTSGIDAEHGGAEAQYDRARQYANGEGVPQSYEEAVKWYLKAAEQNHALAEFNLGILYASGHGVTRDDPAAQKWFGKSASHGDAGAQHQLGVTQYRASLWGPLTGRPEARIEAYKWFRLAAAQGYVGSETARDTVTLEMSREDVTEAVQRANRLVPGSRDHLAA